MQAIISIFADEGSHLRCARHEDFVTRLTSRDRTVLADNLRISFLLKAPLYYVAVSEWAEPDSIVRASRSPFSLT
jgi:hypothetical protein